MHGDTTTKMTTKLTYRSEEDQVLLNREVVEEYVILRAITKALAGVSCAGRDVKAANYDVARATFCESWR